MKGQFGHITILDYLPPIHGELYHESTFRKTLIISQVCRNTYMVPFGWTPLLCIVAVPALPQANLTLNSDFKIIMSSRGKCSCETLQSVILM